MHPPLLALLPADDITAMLQKTFPHMLSYETKKILSQASAEGHGILLTLHEDEAPYDHEVVFANASWSRNIATKKDWADLQCKFLCMFAKVAFYQET
jgi:hypothetical protein